MIHPRFLLPVVAAAVAGIGEALASVTYTGVNLAGAEFGNVLPGTKDVNYVYPTSSEVDYYLGKGMNTFRLPFLWERLVPDLDTGALDDAQLGYIADFVNAATSKGAYVILDAHNYAQYTTAGGTLSLGSEQLPISRFTSLWSRLAAVFAGNDHVLFGLMNEPKGSSVIATETWFQAAQSAIDSIRAAGAHNTILVSGNYYSGAWSWVSGASMGTPNATVLADRPLVDPDDNFLFEVHQYLDANYSGTSQEIAHDPVQALTAFTEWLEATGNKGFLGEFAVSEGTAQQAAVSSMLEYLQENSDVWEGWTWWAGGPWWGDYPFSLEPKNGEDAAQMSYISPYFATVPEPSSVALLAIGGAAFFFGKRFRRKSCA